MTYEEAYRRCSSVDEIKKAALTDTQIAFILGSNQDRLKAIEKAMNKVIAELESK